MKTHTRNIITYEAFDGTFFSTEHECLSYENEISEHFRFQPAKTKNTTIPINDTDLLRRCVRTSTPTYRKPRWVIVSERFALGSTYSQLLCERFGFDPFELKKRKQK